MPGTVIGAMCRKERHLYWHDTHCKLSTCLCKSRDLKERENLQCVILKKGKGTFFVFYVQKICFRLAGCSWPNLKLCHNEKKHNPTQSNPNLDSGGQSDPTQPIFWPWGLVSTWKIGLCLTLLKWVHPIIFALNVFHNSHLIQKSIQNQQLLLILYTLLNQRKTFDAKMIG